MEHEEGLEELGSLINRALLLFDSTSDQILMSVSQLNKTISSHLDNWFRFINKVDTVIQLASHPTLVNKGMRMKSFLWYICKF